MGRLVASRPFRTRIAEAYRWNCDSYFILESRSIQLEPIAQTIAACIVPRDTCLVHLSPRRLADDPSGSSDSQIAQART